MTFRKSTEAQIACETDLQERGDKLEIEVRVIAEFLQ